MPKRCGSSRPRMPGIGFAAALWVGVATILVASGCGGDGADGGGGPIPAVGSYATDVTPSPDDASTAYALLFVVRQGAVDELAAYLISCGSPGWTLPTIDELVGTSVKIEDGQFTIDNAAVTLNGRFRDSLTIEGTVAAKSEEAARCGVPTSANWVATCGKQSGVRTLFVEGEAVPLGSGPCKPPS